MALTRALRLPPPPHRLADALSHLYADHGAGPPRWGEVRVWATLARWPAWLDEGLVFEVELAPQALPDLGAVTSGALWLTGEGWRARLDLGEAPIRAPETPEIAPCLALTWDTPSRPPQRIDLAGAPWLVRLAALEAALEGRSPQTLRLRLRGAREALEAHLATLAPLGAP
ncbi:hypothetical protein KJ940_22090, partial [Myxococcota bacterium]|nr:hypothetical protein [Myxococcota bacterium]